MEKRIKFETIMPFINDAFNRGEAFAFKPNGISMLPFIKGGFDKVCLEKYEGGCKRYDIVFYIRDDGKYVLHRIVGFKDEKILVCGDNQWYIEEIKEDMIFARVCWVEGKNMQGIKYFVYCRMLFLRRFTKHIVDFLKRHIGGMKK